VVGKFQGKFRAIFDYYIQIIADSYLDFFSYGSFQVPHFNGCLTKCQLLLEGDSYPMLNQIFDD
jgi:hypothetical protein